ncbi:GNAT family N-acetyltransferase [Elizabethkingia meningoseptica]|uniref:GNAT family N-acetyltransferase n=2 Tax=Elizabethkingia meningoseptica TaxID=238 RepID=UPI002010D89B|nr:GNAT family N-acetyltransferase [Elizabethkingia meningoseptica]EJK5329516.1 GNAT family N-acetyltransferase [Elizabethkingia meningoseptica]MDE5430538.1 GNAT family N-acetyltransferase [Elizabethkingia meningoseptica]MDE5469356.1 GNAT family N-acetyltransferase [Elizabethkingia meningoseptica]MDE5475270.1 GNAT family N-acetyltransferase [Elizabethkingia meningoseptica]MDE5478703.1 GNAT family N-acetyltransferase [Elizabethkingia meningoseptica]
MMREEIELRLAQTKDIDIMIPLVRSSFDPAHLQTSIYTCKGIKDFISIEINNPYSPYKYFVAILNDKLAGFAEFKLFPETNTAFLNMIATDNTYKGKGVAKCIFNKSVEYFKQYEYNNIQLDVFNSNPIAQKWYKSIGFINEKKTYFHKYNGIVPYIKGGKLMILNLPQFYGLYEKFGFSFLQTAIDNKPVNIGVINKNIILRNEVISLEHIKNIQELFKEYGFTNLYYIGNDSSFENFEYLDEIYRMKLNI